MSKNQQDIKSKDYENSVHRYASWAYQETFLVFLMTFFGYTVQFKKLREGNTHRFARIHSIYYEIDNTSLKELFDDQEISTESQNCSVSLSIEDEIKAIKSENIVEEKKPKLTNMLNKEMKKELNGLHKTNKEMKHLKEESKSPKIYLNSKENSSEIYCSENSNINNNETIPMNGNTTRYLLFEDTEYFENQCTGSNCKITGSKNINDFAKFCCLFIMYFFNTFGIQFKIKGEGKTFPIISELTYGGMTLNFQFIQEFGSRYFPMMVRGETLTMERILSDMMKKDQQKAFQLQQFLMLIQSGVYQNVKNYVMFIKFISEKFYNLYCRDDRIMANQMVEDEMKYMMKREEC